MSGGDIRVREQPLQPNISEIEFLCLHVGGRIKVEGPTLCVWDQVGIFINLQRTEISQRNAGKSDANAPTGEILTSSPEKYRSIISKANL